MVSGAPQWRAVMADPVAAAYGMWVLGLVVGSVVGVVLGFLVGFVVGLRTH